MTRLYLLRHGEAEKDHPTQPGDRARRLTPGGEADIKRLAQTLVNQERRPVRILHSPYRRAEQTAILVGAAADAQLEALPLLVPGGSVRHVLEHLAGVEDDRMLVSHLPLIAMLAESILRHGVNFSQGSCLEIDLHDPYGLRGALTWAWHAEDSRD